MGDLGYNGNSITEVSSFVGKIQESRTAPPGKFTQTLGYVFESMQGYVLKGMF